MANFILKACRWMVLISENIMAKEEHSLSART
jgi:hypothetical protein